MNKEKLGQEPAFSNSETYNPNNMEANGMFSPGMSKRFYAACAALTGIMANSNPDFIKMDFKTAVGHAYRCADHLLDQENK
jgi:hypothetical protein